MTAPARIPDDLEDLAQRAALPGVSVLLICACRDRRHHPVCGSRIMPGARDCAAGCRSRDRRECGALSA